MKYTIYYKYNRVYENPFVANAYDESGTFVDSALSKESFKDAKDKLLHNLGKNIPVATIPQPEEVEI